MVFFKDLVENLENELVKLASFFEVQTLSREHLHCILRNSRGSFKRASYQIPDNSFSSLAKAKIDLAISDVEYILRSRLGLESNL